MNYLEAERHFQEALETAEGLGPQDNHVAMSLNNQGKCLWTQERYAEAEQCLKQSLKIFATDQRWLHARNSLAELLQEQGNFNRLHRFTRTS